MYETDLKFRNINADPRDSITRWGSEGVYAAIERGGILDWARIVSEVEKNRDNALVLAAVREALDIAIADGFARAKNIRSILLDKGIAV